MKTKNIVLSLLTVTVLLVGSNLRAAWQDGWKLTGMGVNQSSFTIPGPLRIKSVYASTDTVLPGAAGANYLVIIDTGNPTNNAVFTAFTSDRKGLASFFPTTATINVSGINGMTKVQDYGDDGLYISSAATVWQSAVPSGEALRAFILWRK